MHAVGDPLGYLAGGWAVERAVRDLSAGVSGSFRGSAVFAPSAGGLDYREEGWLDWAGRRVPASREYRYAGPGPRLRVSFADGRPFHDLDLRSGTWRAHHPCGADAYDGRFTVLGADRWRLVWEVTGPGKRLRLATDYRRV